MAQRENQHQTAWERSIQTLSTQRSPQTLPPYGGHVQRGEGRQHGRGVEEGKGEARSGQRVVSEKIHRDT